MLSLTLVAPYTASAQQLGLAKIMEQAAETASALEMETADKAAALENEAADKAAEFEMVANETAATLEIAAAEFEMVANETAATLETAAVLEMAAADKTAAEQNEAADKAAALKNEAADKAAVEKAKRQAKLAETLARIDSKIDNEIRKKFEKAINEKIDSVNTEVETVRVIIRAQPGYKASLENLSSQGAAIQDGIGKFQLFDGIVVEVPADLLDTLADNYDVASLHLDANIELSQNGNGTPGELATVTGALDAALAYGVTGAGIGIAVIDSGIGGHVDLPNVVHTVDFTGGNTGGDEFGHGTHVAGIVAGNGMASGGQYAGMAPGAHLIDLKVLSASGGGQTSDVIEALEWAILNRDIYNIRVINLSLGHMPYESADTDPMTLMVRAAVDAGIVVVVSAGNGGKNADGEIQYGAITSPGTEASALTVGAMTTWDTPSRSDDTVASYSSRGPTRFEELIKPDIAAPGTQIVAARAAGNALATNHPQIVVDNNYMWLSGTSMSAPVVAGAVALMLEQNPYLTPNQVKAILMYTAEGNFGNPYAVGAGYMNAAGAVNLAANVDATTAEGDYWLLNNGVGLDYSNVISGYPAVWSETIVWGKGLYEADNFDYNETSYGQTIVWGKTITWEEVEGETIVWGKTIVWDEVDAETIVWGKTITWDDF